MGLTGSTATTLDLRYNGKLPPEISPVFDSLSYELRGSFNELVARLSIAHIASIDWWVHGPASRNTLASPLFHYCCCLHLVRWLADDKRFPFGRVVVDSHVMKDIITGLLADAGIRDCRIRFVPSAGSTAAWLIKRAVATPVFLTRKVIQTLIARLTRGASSEWPSDRPIVAIDTFVMPAYVTSDRWYGTFWDHLTDEMKAETYFVPTLVLTPLRLMHSTYRRLRASARHVLIKEDYLGLDDFLFVLRHKRRVKGLSIGPVMVVGHDISALVKEEMAVDRDAVTTIESLLTYRFIRRLSQSGRQVRLAIDWFEGQVIDKAWNLGFKRYFPTVRRIGYRAFETAPFSLSTFPIPIEREAGVVPDAITVQGRGTIETVREFMPNLDVIVIPAFRSQHVWDPDTDDSSRRAILVGLPISLHASVRIINRLIDAATSLGRLHDKLRMVVKPHPATPMEKLKGMLKVDLPPSLVFTAEKSFPRLLADARVLITEASTVCLEALARGVPVIIVENEEGLTYDPVPRAIATDLYRRTRTQAELVGALTHYMTWSPADAQRQRQEGQRIRELYFEPITREGIDRFMNVNAEQPEASNA